MQGKYVDYSRLFPPQSPLIWHYRNSSVRQKTLKFPVNSRGSAYQDAPKCRRWVRNFVEFVEEHGFGSCYVYSPCHGSGIMEVERPWMQSNSTYTLESNMTFMADTFFITPDYGFRWEDGWISGYIKWSRRVLKGSSKNSRDVAKNAQMPRVPHCCEKADKVIFYMIRPTPS
jgi:hypothetical protein